jgi:DNA-binding MarR family transcriptional regulator
MAAIDRKKLIDELLEDIHSMRRRFLMESQRLAGDVTFSQLILLQMIGRAQGISIKDIAGKLGVTSSAATQIVDGLVKKGYLTREGDPNDHRALKIKLDVAGTEKLKSIRNRHLAKLYAIFDTLEDDELEVYCRLSRKIIGKTGKR